MDSLNYFICFLSIIIVIPYNTNIGVSNNEVLAIPILTEIFVAITPIIGPPKICPKAFICPFIESTVALALSSI
ncbi:hypothetical protein SDC9_178069 [bioreactor metagenome]|uniref:Uncharacterized protein n=1 Tax=bioreactor metagenome TaxID=1076179 RepID=A0A645GUS8_9ZZZZ